MSRAEKQALKAYPDYVGFDDVSKTLEHVRGAYVKGYEQAKQELVDKLIKEFSFNANRYKEYADKELKEIGETQNQARLGGLADGYLRALEYVQKITEKI